MNYRAFRSVVQSAAVLVCFSGYAHAGLIEVCKDDIPVGSLSGLAIFAIAGQAGTVTVPVGACSSAIQLPDGPAAITEIPQPGSSLISVLTFPDDRLISFDPTTDTAVVLTVAGDISNETVVTFTNAPIYGVPEPGTGPLFSLGLILWAVRKRSTLARSVLDRLRYL
jgi:hypothetical protein